MSHIIVEWSHGDVGSQFSFDDCAEVMQIEDQFYWENARTNMNRVMKLKPSGGCRAYLAAFVATLASVVQLIAQEVNISWANPSTIVYGTALSGAQLNAVATRSDTGGLLSGTYSYNPPLQTVLPAGADQSLSVTFFPDLGQGVPITSVSATVQISVVKKDLRVVAPSVSKQYGTEVANYIASVNGGGENGSITYEGFVNGDSFATVSFSTPPALSIDTGGGSGATFLAGTFKPIVFANTNPTAANYNLILVNGTLTVVRKDLVFTLAPQAKLYGETPVPSTGDLAVGTPNAYEPAVGSSTAQGQWENGDQTKVTVRIRHNVKTESAVGSYDIFVDINEIGPDVTRNYRVIIDNSKYVVDQRPLLVMVTPGARQITYGDSHGSFGATFTIDETGAPFSIPNVAKTGNALQNSAGVITTPFGLELPASNSGAGTIEIKVLGGTTFNNNFSVTRTSGFLTILKSTLTVKAANRVKVFGTALPGLTIEYPSAGSQLKFGDSVSVISPAPTVAYAAGFPGNQPPNAPNTTGEELLKGLYIGAIVISNAGSLAADNYNIVALPGDLTVDLLPPLFNWTPTAVTLVYGQLFEASKHLNASIITPIPGTTTPIPGTFTYAVRKLDGTPLLAADIINSGDNFLNVGEGLHAGTYIVKMTFTPDAPHNNSFGAATAERTFNVSKKPVDVTANDQTWVFGNKVFNENSITIDGTDFVFGETAAVLDELPKATTPETSNSNVGEYSIGLTGGVDGDYSFVFKSGKLTITKQPTTLVWNPPAADAGDADKWMTYGSTMQGTGNANAEPPASISGSVTYSADINNPGALTVPGQNVKATFTPSSSNFEKSEVTRFLNVKRRMVPLVPGRHEFVVGDAIPSDDLPGGDRGVAGEAGDTTPNNAGDDFLPQDGIVVKFTTAANHGTLPSVAGATTFFIDAAIDDSLGRINNYQIELSSDTDNRVFLKPAQINIAVQPQSSAVNDPEKPGSIVITGLTGAAAVLNGVPLTSAEISNIIDFPNGGATPLTSFSKELNGTAGIQDDEIFNNSDDDILKTQGLLSGVFNTKTTVSAAGKPDNVLQIVADGFSNAEIKQFPLNLILDNTPIGAGDPPDTDPISVFPGNFNVMNVANNTYSVGLDTPMIDWPDPAAITYGTALSGTQLNAKINAAESDLLDADGKSLGTFTYTVSGASASGIVPPAGSSVINLVYTTPADKRNKFVETVSLTKTLTVNKAPLSVRAPDLSLIYGDMLPLVTPEQLIYGTGDNNANNNFVNGDTVNVFNPPAGRQPVVALFPADPEQGFVVGPNGTVTFGQQPQAANYNIVLDPGSLTIVRRTLIVKPMDTTMRFGDMPHLGVEYLSPRATAPAFAPGETAENLTSPAQVFRNSSTPLENLVPGMYPLFATGAFGSNYTVQFEVGELTVLKAIAGVTVGNNSYVFDGLPKGVSVETNPPGLAYTVTYNGASLLPVNAGTYDVQVTVNDPLYEAVVNSTLTISPAAGDVVLSNLVATYDGAAKSASATTVPPGLPVEFTYNGFGFSPAQAGSYNVVATIVDSNYSGFASGTFTINKATASVALNNLRQVADGSPKTVGTSTTPAGLTVEVLYDLQPTAPTKAGTYTVTAKIVDKNYTGEAMGKLQLVGAPTISLTGLEKTYNGQPQSPTVTTTPAGLNVSLTFNKNPTVPTNAGTYEVVATINDPVFTGSATGIFRIKRAPVSVSFVEDSLETPWNQIRGVQVVTDPSGMNTMVTYNGSSTVPTAIGQYEVKAVVNEPNYEGEAVATFTVGKANQTITFPAVPNLDISGSALVLILNATASSNLPITYTVARGSATISGTLLTITQPGEIIITAQQLGNEFYNPAEEKVRSWRVSGTGVPLGAPTVSGTTNADGNFQLNVSGSAGQELTVYSTGDVTSEWQPLVKMVLNDAGSGSYVDGSTQENDAQFFKVE